MNTVDGQLELIPRPSRVFRPPTIEEVLLAAAKSGMPEIEAHKFWNHYESVNWFRGRTKMAKWRSALAVWRLKWQSEPKRFGGGLVNKDEESLAFKEFMRITA